MRRGFAPEDAAKGQAPIVEMERGVLNEHAAGKERRGDTLRIAMIFGC